MGERWLDVQQDLGRGWQLSFLIAVRGGGGGGGAQEWQSSFQEWSYLGADMMMLKLYLIRASSHTRIIMVQMMLSTLFDISFSNIQKHMHECPLWSSAQHLTPFSPMSYWRKRYHSFLTDQVPFPVFDHKYRCSPRIRQFSITLHTLHKWFADDSAILSQLFAHSNTDTYFPEVNQFTECCTDNFLELNNQKI